jgi:hypothetical protein
MFLRRTCALKHVSTAYLLLGNMSLRRSCALKISLCDVLTPWKHVSAANLLLESMSLWHTYSLKHVSTAYLLLGNMYLRRTCTLKICLCGVPTPWKHVYAANLLLESMSLWYTYSLENVSAVYFLPQTYLCGVLAPANMSLRHTCSLKHVSAVCSVLTPWQHVSCTLKICLFGVLDP